MHHGHEDELGTVMENEFEKKVGTSIPIKVDQNHLPHYRIYPVSSTLKVKAR